MPREGYLLIDHRASPGLPGDLAQAVGLDPNLVREGRMFEAATLTCRHCRTVVVKNPWRQRERASCMKCGGHYICDSCAFEASMPDYSHLPFERQVDLVKEAEAKGIPNLGSPPRLLMP